MYPSDTVAARVKELRRNRGLTAQQLAELCKDAGAPELTAASIANIETGRRKEGRRTRIVTVDEALILAHVLDAPVALLFLPPEAGELDVTPEVRQHPADVVAWFAGEVAPDPAHWDAWLETTGPVSLYMDLRHAIVNVLRAGEPEQVNEMDLQLAVTLLDKAAEAGLRPFELRREWYDLLRRHVKHPAALRVIEER